MKFAGVDLHKRSLLVCVVDGKKDVLVTKRLMCVDVEAVRTFFQELGEFQAVVEATASYEWFVRLIEPYAAKVVLAHPGKMRVIAESKRKTDKFDARVLARALAADEVPTAYRPTPSQRDHRRLVRLRCTIQKRTTAIKNQVRRIFSDHNADFPDLFDSPLSDSMASVGFSEIERFELEQLDGQRTLLGAQFDAVTKRVRTFVKGLPAKEREDREILESIPQVGPVTSEVVLAELAGPERFSSQKKAVAYAGLVPGRRSSDGKTKELHIEKTGSGLLRWVLVEAAWRLVRTEAMWGVIFEDLSRRKGKKKAIVAIARRLLCLMVGLLHRRERYDGTKLRHTGLETVCRANPDLRDDSGTPTKTDAKRTGKKPMKTKKNDSGAEAAPASTTEETSKGSPTATAETAPAQDGPHDASPTTKSTRTKNTQTKSRKTDAPPRRHAAGPV